MKKLAYLSLIAMLFASIQNCFAQWTNLNANLQGELHSVYFINENEGHVAGENGIFQTTNGGDSWAGVSIQNNPADLATYANTVFKNIAYNGFTWVATGTDQTSGNGVIFAKSIASPFKWKLVYSDANGRAINDVYFENNWGVAVGENGLVLKAFDIDAAVWTETATGINSPIKTVTMGNFQSLLNAADGLYFEVTTDNWEKISDRTFVDILGAWWNTIAISQDSSFNISQNAGYFYVEPQRKLPQGYMGSCLGINGSSIAAGTSNGMLKNLGSWEIQPSATGFHINSFHFPSFNTGYAVGKNGVILKTLDNGGTTTPVAEFIGPNGGCVNQSLYFVSFSDYSNYHTWQLDNEPPVSGQLMFSFITPPITSTGQHSLSLTVSNGVESATKTITFQVTDPPSTSFTYTLPATPICKSGQTNVMVHNTSPNAAYRLQSLQDPALTTAFVPGNGGTISLQTKTLTEPVNYFYIEVKSAISDCQASLYDSIALHVEKTEAKFQASLINAVPGEEIVFANSSHDAVSLEWDFGANAAVQQASTQTVTNSFSSTGPASVKLIATSTFGCKDTIAQADLFIYDPSGPPSDCWAVLENGVESPDQAYEHDSAEGVAFDKQGNAYYCGEYHRAVFQSKLGTPSPLNEGSGFYLAKYNAEGALKWLVKSVEVEGCCFTNETHPGTAYDLDIDKDGNIVLVGWTLSGATIYDSHGDTIQIQLSQQGVGGFVMKISPEGQIIWHGLLSSIVKVVDSDAAGNIFIAGELDGLYWPPNNSQMTFPAPMYEYSRYGLVKLSPDGDFIWKLDIGSGYSSGYSDLADISVTSNGEIYISGSYGSPGLTFFSVNAPLFEINSLIYYSAAYLAKISPQGNLIWVNTVKTDNDPLDPNGVNVDYAGQVVSDAENNVYFTVLGSAIATTAISEFTSADGSTHTFDFGSYLLASYDGNGILRWVTGAKEVQGSYIQNIAVGPCGKIYVAGNMVLWDLDQDGFGTGLFINADGTTEEVTTDNRRFIVAAYSPDGILENVEEIGEYENMNSDYLYFFANQIALDASDNLAIAGTIWAVNGAYNFYMANDTLSPSEEDGFFAKFSPDFCEAEVLGNITGAVPNGQYCPGDTLQISFAANGIGNIGTGNEWQLAMSDVSGCLGASTVLQSLQSDAASGNFQYILPNDLSPGEYWLQVNATAPSFSGVPFSFNLNAPPVGQHLSYTVCEGQSIALLATDGEAWQWSPSDGLSSSDERQPISTPQIPTVYTVNIMGFCGVATDTFEVGLHPSLEVGIVQDTFLCVGDTMFIKPNDGISLKWHLFFNEMGIFTSDSAVIFPYLANNYYYTAYDDATGCHALDTLFIDVKQVYFDGIPSYYTACPNTDYIVEAFSNDPIYIEWEDHPAVDPTGPTTAILHATALTYISYSVSLEGFGCPRNDSILFDLFPVTPPELLYEAPYLITTSNYPSYQWYFNGEPIPGATDFNLVPMDTGYYQAAVLDGNGCTVFSDSLLILPLASNDLDQGSLSVYPNPFSSTIELESKDIDFKGEMALEDATGRTLIQLKQFYLPINGKEKIDGSRLPAGIYFLCFKDDNGQVLFRKKLVKAS